ncbi:MAG: hypothetical protein AAGJ46_19400 [Planctomycetota bacterium]
MPQFITDKKLNSVLRATVVLSLVLSGGFWQAFCIKALLNDNGYGVYFGMSALASFAGAGVLGTNARVTAREMFGVLAIPGFRKVDTEVKRP